MLITKDGLLKPHLIALAFLGFNSGLAFILLSSTLTMALAFSGFSAAFIGMLFLTSLPYSLKILWAPLMDYYAVPQLKKLVGHRRSWLLITQISLFFMSLGLAIKPNNSILLFIVLIICAFLAASQDIALDAYRLERLESNELAVGSTFSMTGFRVGMIIGSTIPLYLLATYGWTTTFLITSVTLLIGPVTTLMVQEPTGIKRTISSTLPSPIEHIQSVVDSLLDFFKRPDCLLIILFIFFYKVGDSIPNAMKGPLLKYLEFTPIETANISQAYGILLMILGGFLGGLLASKLGIFRSIIIGGAIQLLSPLMHTWLSITGHNINMLILTTTVHSLCCGLGSTILVIYVSSLCKKGASASQFSLIWSFSSLTRIILSSSSGLFANYTDWTTFFVCTTLLGLPIFIIIKKLAPSFEPKCQN
jgi:MFS family permease